MSIPTADVVVVAAGTSSRMAGLDKLTAPIAGRPLLGWTLEAFTSDVPVERIAVVVAPERVAEFAAASWLPGNARLVAGGARRQESVAAGVLAIGADASADRVVLVHDGARPAARPELIRAVIEAAAVFGAAVPILPVVETLKRVVGGTVEGTVDRTNVGAAQTPQGVRLGLLREAYRRFPPAGPDVFTDEAALLEACTIPVHVVPGQSDNLKVTLPADLDRAAAILAPDRPRVGFGEDAHPFGSGGPLALGGVELAGAPRLHGHSDGDVVLHAVADALLGAAGLGDLGRLFPADQRTQRGIASSELLGAVLGRVRDAGYQPASIDITVVAARPRLGDRLDAMRDRIADITGMPADAVNVKASTGNLGGDEGAGRGIAARAVVTLAVRR
ncbi:MAG TPA: 2-C-methyl-D-erythritol 2,4-cyclodiphosphate synthase [Candidatus Limnocylindrales bacterium]|nr:2-C-methyl-D-erythritol 2,4-cyclodiphosphate synthase [Candidatus Limnocylindrales bacterium]